MWSLWVILVVQYNALFTQEMSKYQDIDSKWALECTSTVNPDWGGSNGIMIKYVQEGFEIGYNFDIELHSHSIVYRQWLDWK